MNFVFEFRKKSWMNLSCICPANKKDIRPADLSFCCPFPEIWFPLFKKLIKSIIISILIFLFNFYCKNQ